MKLLGSILVFSSLLQTCWSQNSSIATPPNGTSCWSNTTAIHDHLFNATPFSSNTYILCPDTVYNIGHTDSQGVCCVEGDNPLMARTNTKYQCGDDGSSANNCTFVGGTFQVVMSALSFQEQEATNVVVQGMTFSNPSLAIAIPSQSGDMTFVDCIFEV
jgi:hypothetical protein